MSIEPDKSSQAAVVRTVVESTTKAEQEMLLGWAQKLLAIRNGGLPVYRKAVQAIKATQESKAIWPLLKITSKELKRVGWDDRSWKARIGLGAVLATLASVGSAGAGIAALGGGIGLPLWVVVGAGGTFIGLLVDELIKKLGKPESSYTVLDAKKKPVSGRNDLQS